MKEGYVSVRLQEVAAYYSNRMSYEEVARLIERMSGERLLSDQVFIRLSIAKPNKLVSLSIKLNKIERIEEKTLIPVKTEINVYDKSSEEILLFEDGIGMKAQSQQRHSPAERNNASLVSLTVSDARTTVLTDIVLIQTAPQTFEYLSAPITEWG
ncbi:MAG TPA: hypothetical protein V6C65_27005, partial [Allocoleopsis sp.]